MHMEPMELFPTSKGVDKSTESSVCAFAYVFDVCMVSVLA